MTIDITNISKAEILAALYNASKLQGLGWLQAESGAMTKEQAQHELDASPDKYFDYFHGKVMKIDLRGNELRTGLYDRDNGEGAAQRAIKHLLP